MSQAAVNEAVRVLTQRPLAFTVVIHMKNGTVYEVQSKKEPKIKWSNESRSSQLCVDVDSYDFSPVCEWSEVGAVFTEKN